MLRLLILVACIGLTAAACDDGDGGAEPTAQLTPLGSTDEPVESTATPLPPAATATVRPPPAASLEILSDLSRTDASTGSAHIEGQIRNNSARTCRFIQIVASLYDAAGKFVGSESGFASIDPLPAGQISPFDVLIIDPPTFERYELQAQGGTEVFEAC